MPKISVVSQDANSIEFDLTDTTVVVANSLRRIMMAEVPTMAIKTCRIRTNSSNIPDETLAHRLGLVPIKVDPSLFEYAADENKLDDSNAIFLKLDVECTSTDGKPLNVYAKDIAIGYQRTFVEIVHPNILLAKLLPGQKLSIDMECIKGQGGVHAKWSPVSSCAYRLLPTISLKQKFKGEQAQRLQTCFPEGVIVLDENGVAQVANARKCIMGTEIYRHPDLAEHVEQKRVPDYYMFYVESIGALTPEQILSEAIRICSEKHQVVFSDRKKGENVREGGAGGEKRIVWPGRN